MYNGQGKSIVGLAWQHDRVRQTSDAIEGKTLWQWRLAQQTVGADAAEYKERERGKEPTVAM